MLSGTALTACAGRAGSQSQWLARGVLHLIIPVSPMTQARRVEITHAPGGSRTLSGSTSEQGEAPAGGAGGG